MTPTRTELAQELAERNERCGSVSDERICLRVKNHKDDHQYELIRQVVPIE